MGKRVEFERGGLVCDSPTCDWEDKSISMDDYPKYLNAACPKCGENILTEEDYINVLRLVDIVDFVNGLSDKEMEKLRELPEFKGLDLELEENGMYSMTINTHKELKVDKIEKIK